MTTGKLQTLDRGIAALMLIARAPNGVKIAHLSEALGLHRAVAYRIVATLADHAMIRRLEDGRIVLGAGAYLLGSRTADGIQAVARPILETLAERTGATAFLSTAEGNDCVVVMTAEPRNASVAIHYRVGTRHPIHRGAAGIAILAARASHSDDTEDVRTARAQGYSVTRGQLHKGAMGISSAVKTGAAFAGVEFSVGVVALEELDLDLATQEVPRAAKLLAEQII